ncbi:MAG: hypothetical protein ACT4ON_08595 [Bacteroidota bacterium]
MKHTYTFFILLVLFASIILSSCEIYNPSEPIPAYIHIDKIDLATSSDGSQGTNSHKITDAWVYIDEKLVGCFELPVTFPLLYEGTHLLMIKAGIKVNGIAATRSPYPFYDSYTQPIDLQKGATINLTPTVKYVNTMNFAFMENFENVGMTIDTTPNSLATFQKITSPPEYVFEGSNSSISYLDATRNFFECATINKYILPKGGSDVFLEFNYKCDYHFTVSVIAFGTAGSAQLAALSFNPSADWNKAYVYLTPTVSGVYTAIDYKIVWGTIYNGTDSVKVLLDNIKLLHF